MNWYINPRRSCNGEDTELFFDPHREDEDLAKAVCGDCPVIAVCLAAALGEESDRGRYMRYGVRGGMTPAERYAIDCQRNCSECGADVPHIRRQSSTCSPECRLLQLARQWGEGSGRRRGLPQSNIVRDDDPRHGTNAGCSAHGKTKVPMCDPCREAWNAMQRGRSHRKRVAA